MVATDDYGVTASADFEVGIIAMIIHPTSGPVGTNVQLTGVGFKPGPYNATFGSIRVITNGIVSRGETISDNFIVPNVAPGTYTLTVEDSGNHDLSMTFQMTSSLYILALRGNCVVLVSITQMLITVRIRVGINKN